MRARSTDEWLEALEAVGVPCGPINTLDRVFADPQVVHRGLRMDLPHLEAGKVPQVANPIRYSRTLIEYEDAPPVLGQHTDQVLGELLGIEPGRIAELRRAGIV